MTHIAQQNHKAPVTERALVQRLNRRLAKDSQKLCASRSPAAESDLGKFYVVDTAGGSIAACLFDLDGLGRDLGALQPWEELGG